MKEKRIMRILVMFDLPTLTIEQQREYRKFRKWLLKDGFIMMQESIYTKLVLNGNSVKLVMDKIKLNKTKKGIIQVLVLSEKEFNSIEFITGETTSNVLSSLKRVVII